MRAEHTTPRTSKLQRRRYGNSGILQSGSGSAGSSLLEALPAEDRPALRGFEGNRRLLAAAGAIGSGLHSGVVSRRRAPQGRGAFRLAGFATFGLVLELLVMEEQLFSGGKDKLGAAVDALQNPVLIFHGDLLPLAPDC